MSMYTSGANQIRLIADTMQNGAPATREQAGVVDAAVQLLLMSTNSIL